MIEVLEEFVIKAGLEEYIDGDEDQYDIDFNGTDIAIEIIDESVELKILGEGIRSDDPDELVAFFKENVNNDSGKNVIDELTDELREEFKRK